MTRREYDDDGWGYITRRQWVAYFLIAVALVVGAYVLTVAAIVSAP